LSPEGAGRRGAFRQAKRQNGVPVTQHPTEIGPNIGKQGQTQPGREYKFKVLDEGASEPREVIIRDDAGGHFYGRDNAQNRGPHFNDGKKNHYDY
jgi:filamentous hemagglutinin